jgi:hypothetical protein
MSTLDPPLARLPQAFAALAEDAVPGADCPEPERLWSAVAGELPATDARSLVLHTAACPSCAESWRLARALVGETHVRRPATARTRWRGGPLSMAAAVAAVVLAGGAVLRQSTGPVAPRYRDPRDEVLRALVTEDRPFSRADCVLRWSAIGEGARYDLRVATTTLRVVYSVRGLAATEHPVPAEALAGLPAGTRLLWQVEATTPDGTRATSPTFVVRIQ